MMSAARSGDEARPPSTEPLIAWRTWTVALRRGSFPDAITLERELLGGYAVDLLPLRVHALAR